MKWILFLTIVGHDPGTGGHWEFDTQADCEQAAIAFLSIWPSAVNGRPFPGISFECKSRADWVAAGMPGASLAEKFLEKGR
jgi:hypothetical protein